MKKILIILSIVCLFTACDKGDDNLIIHPVDNSGTNLNANSTNANDDYARLELPRFNKAADNRILVHKTSNGDVNYVVEWNDTKRAQRWTAYQLNPTNSVKKGSRKGWWPERDPFQEDQSIPQAYRSTLDQYYRSGYDRGHILPSFDRLNSKEASEQTFYLSNIQPQINEFNTGIWLTAENRVSKLGGESMFRDVLYICKGGTIDKSSDYTIGSKNLLVPKYYYMALLRVKGGKYDAIALFFEHKANTDTNLAKYTMSIDQLEARTGIDFFCNLADETENAVEAKANPSLWGM